MRLAKYIYDYTFYILMYPVVKLQKFRKLLYLSILLQFVWGSILFIPALFGILVSCIVAIIEDILFNRKRRIQHEQSLY